MTARRVGVVALSRGMRRRAFCVTQLINILKPPVAKRPQLGQFVKYVGCRRYRLAYCGLKRDVVRPIGELVKRSDTQHIEPLDVDLEISWNANLAEYVLERYGRYLHRPVCGACEPAVSFDHLAVKRAPLRVVRDRKRQRPASLRDADAEDPQPAGADLICKLTLSGRHQQRVCLDRHYIKTFGEIKRCVFASVHPDINDEVVAFDRASPDVRRSAAELRSVRAAVGGCSRDRGACAASHYGITIWMYWEEGAHARPHFHARYSEYQASVGFDGEVVVVVGWLPSRALAFVEEWALLHADELQANWDRARDNQPLLPIEPLA